MQEEKIIQSKSCRHCAKSFDITDKDLEFYDKISLKINWQKYQIPTPTLCPDCRQQRRLSFRNERKLYRRKCDASGKDIISIYSPDKPYKIYDQKVRRSDDRDPMKYGRDFNFDKSFTEQFGDMMKAVPRYNLSAINCENCDYCTYISNAKNCYLCYASSWSCDMYYCWFSMKSNNLIDCYKCKNSQIWYESISCKNSYKIFYCKNLKDCTDCYYSSNLQWCAFCFLCNNLDNKKYCINNIE